MAAETATPVEDGQGGEGRPDPIRAQLQAIVGRLEKEADDRVSKRDMVEKRWLEDIRQYHGAYDEKLLRDLKTAGKSTLFINQTRQKTNVLEARLSNMLFPTDDRNWGIQPTPVPELVREAEESAMALAKAKTAAAENPQDPQVQQRATALEQAMGQIQSRMDEARRRSKAMEDEIDDHLKECRYSVQARDVIHDGCKLGTGIMKGPVIGGRSRPRWMLQEPPASEGVAGKVVNWMRSLVGAQQNPKQGPQAQFVMVNAEDPRPTFWRVDPWSFFPEMDGRTIEDTESILERHLMNPKELRRLARQPGFLKDNIRTLLKDSPRGTTPTYISDLRTITGAYHDDSTDRYHVWEYHGPLSADDMRLLATHLDKPDMLDDLGEDVDPLAEMNVTIWFCQGELLKFGIHPLDSGDAIYSVFNLEKDEASVFGFGVPYLMRDSQSALNAGWRIMMDNAGLSSGPQIVVNKDVVEPADGEWTLAPRKIWFRKAGAAPNANVFESFDVEMHQAELSNIVTMSRQNIDEESGIPLIAQGDQAAHITQTAHGMSILMNSANVVFQRIVKNWDDDMTTPNIRRMYDFLMQFSQKEHIKGDYEVDARGTSVLLVREMQSANLLSFLMNFGAHPTMARFLKDEGLPALRHLVQAMMIPADELIKSDQDIAKDEADAASQPPMPNPEVMKIEAELNLQQMRNENAKEIAIIERDTAMMELAGKSNLSLEEVAAGLEKVRIQTASKERIFAAEAAIESRNAAANGGVTGGSGGYLSTPAPKGGNPGAKPAGRPNG